jgi:hypothetical protein
LAQSNVYSLNVVGYVNKKYDAFKFYTVNNPLNATNNNLATVMPNPPGGTAIYVWDPLTSDFSTNYLYGPPWDVPGAKLTPGTGVFLFSGGDFTNTFVGEVLQGSLTNPVTGNFTFDVIGSIPPVAGSVTTVMTDYTGTAGDQVYQWNADANDIIDNSAFDGVATWTGSVTNLTVGEAFLLFRQGPAGNWVRNFTVQ